MQTVKKMTILMVGPALHMVGVLQASSVSPWMPWRCARATVVVQTCWGAAGIVCMGPGAVDAWDANGRGMGAGDQGRTSGDAVTW